MPCSKLAAPSRTRRTGAAALGLLLALLFTFTGAAWSAEKQATELLGQKAPEVPSTFGVTEIIPRSEEALKQLRGIRSKLDTDTSVAAVGELLPAFVRQLENWRNAGRDSEREGTSPQRVSDILWEAGVREIQINSWQLLVTESSKGWAAEGEKIDRIVATWRATLVAFPADAPLEVRSKAAEVLAACEDVRAQLRQKIAQLIAVQEQLITQHKVLNEVRESLGGLRDQAKMSLFSRDSEPLWSVLTGGHAALAVSSQVGAGLRALYSEARQFFPQAKSRVVAHVLIFMALLASFYLIRRSIVGTPRAELTRAESHALRHVVMSALLLALCWVPVIYPEASPRLLRLAVVPSLVPVLLLSRAVLQLRQRLVLYCFIGIYMLDYVRNYLEPQSLLSRLMLLTVAVLGIAAVVRLLRDPDPEGRARFVSRATLTAILRVILLEFIASFAANLAGNVSLADTLIVPLLRVVFLSFVIYLTTIVAKTFAVMALRTPLAMYSRTVRERGDHITAQLRRIINITGVGFWIAAILFNLGLLADVTDALGKFMRLEWHVGAAVISVRACSVFLIVFGLAYVLSRILRITLAEEVFPRITLPRGVPDVLVLLARYGVLLFGFFLALSAAGVDVSRFVLAFGALGVGIGFGIQHIVNNFVSGLILVFEHPIQVGDYVEVGSYAGQVHRIGFRASVLRTRDGVDVIIPNGELIGTKVLNWSLSDPVRRLTVPVPVPIGTDAGRVVEILIAVARDNPHVLERPAPSAVLEQFGDSALRFLLHAWVRAEDYFPVRDQMTLEINNRLQAAAIQIPFAQRDVYLHLPTEGGIDPRT